MDGPIFFSLPMEVVEHCVQYCDPSDLLAFRLTCSQANAQLFGIMAQHFFSSWTTSLIGDDLEKLEAIAGDENLRPYIKKIRLEDGFERSTDFPAPRTSVIWPRKNAGMVDSKALGILKLRDMLANKALQPETIVIRDYGDNDTSWGGQPVAALAKELTEGADLAITAVKLNQLTSVVAEIVLEFCPEYQGRRVGFSMLHLAHLSRDVEVNTYWSDRAFYHAPALEDLGLSFFQPMRHRVITGEEIAGVLPTGSIQFRLRRLNLSGNCFKGSDIMATLKNSWNTLTHISLSGCRMDQPLTWRRFLALVVNHCPMLTSFYLKALLEGSVQGSRYVNFAPLAQEDLPEEYRAGLVIRVRGPSGNKRVSAVSYEGVGAGDVLQIVAAAASYLH